MKNWVVLIAVGLMLSGCAGTMDTYKEDRAEAQSGVADKADGDSLSAAEFTAVKNTADTADALATENEGYFTTLHALIGPIFGDGDGTYTDMSAISSTELGYLDGVAGAIWHANNDGSGSGLDADTVDGYNAVRIIASGTAALGTSEIASGACATVVTETASGVATTDVVNWGFNADVTSITGYNPSTGVLVIYAYPTANNVNFKVCNLTDGAITPAAVTLNWDVMR
jgi:hypothetical protein